MAATQEPGLNPVITLGRKMRVVVKIVLIVTFPFWMIWTIVRRIAIEISSIAVLAKCDVAEDFHGLKRILRNDHPSFKDQESTDANHDQ